jgi:hypothetical protein
VTEKSVALVRGSSDNNVTATRNDSHLIAKVPLTELNTGNGHTIGQGIARIEETLWRHETRLDSIEVELREASSKVDLATVQAVNVAQQHEDHLLEHRKVTE